MFEVSGTRWQYCRGEDDISGQGYAEDDATEARWWREDGCLVAAFTKGGDGWHLSGSDLHDWVSLAESLDPCRHLDQAVSDLMDLVDELSK
jgi:hypothetical protein